MWVQDAEHVISSNDISGGESTVCFLFVKTQPGNSIDKGWEAGAEATELHGAAKSLPPSSTLGLWSAIDHGDMFLVAGHRLGPTQPHCPSLVTQKGKMWTLMCVNKVVWGLRFVEIV